MDTFLHILKVIGIILLVLLSFNIIIFVHELGHFLAARWRGLQVDRFQIWFGKPIWKKEINGVQWGLGIIPAGGFVALPQMAPMEAIEGENGERVEPLPPIKPIDKIIVAFAGPLFSFLLAVVAACIVYFAGVPDFKDDNRTVGFIVKDSPAEKAGLKLGDKIIKIEGKEVSGFSGKLNGIRESIIFSEGETIDITVIRDGEIIELESGYTAPKGNFFQRDGLRTIGYSPQGDLYVDSLLEGSPASISNFKKDDKILMVNGEKIYSNWHFSSIIDKNADKPITITVEREGKPLDVQTMPMTPSNGWKINNDAPLKPLLGIRFKSSLKQKEIALHNPSPLTQIKDSGLMMWTTLKKLISPQSSINLSHMNGPIGIGKAQYQILSGEYGVRLLFFFWVIFNINLAIFNLLPFPVLDGGHITTAFLEMVRKKPVSTVVLEKIQVLFVLLLFGMLFYVSTKDLFHGKAKPSRKGLPEKPTFDLKAHSSTIKM